MVMRMHLKVTFIRTLTAKFKDAVNLNYCDCVRACVRTYTSTCSPIYIPMRTLCIHNCNMYRADPTWGMCEIIRDINFD